MAEYDRRWRPGCSRNYVDAHDEIWEAVQHEPARFTPDMFARSRHSRPDRWAWASSAINGMAATIAGYLPAPTAWRGTELGRPKTRSTRSPSTPVADLEWALPLPMGSDRGTISGGKLIPWASDQRAGTD